jgi:cytochrome P450
VGCWPSSSLLTRWRSYEGELALIKSALEELLRYTAPVFMTIERYAREDVTLSRCDDTSQGDDVRCDRVGKSG